VPILTGGRNHELLESRTMQTFRGDR
jgi:hypothetical protein